MVTEKGKLFTNKRTDMIEVNERNKEKKIDEEEIAVKTKQKHV